MLNDRRLGPPSLEYCPTADLEPEQVENLIRVLGNDASIPEYRKKRTEYVLIPLTPETHAAQSCLNDALEGLVEGGAMIPLWKGGTQPPRSIRNPTSPRPRLRDIIVVPRTEEHIILVISHFDLGAMQRKIEMAAAGMDA